MKEQNSIVFQEEIILKSSDSFERRSRLDVLYQILLLCREPQQKTQIMFKCNLSYKLLCKYIDFLVSGNLLRILNEVDKKYYQTTEHGEEFISEYEKLKNILNKTARRKPPK